MPRYHTLQVQAFNDGFWTGFIHGRGHHQDLSADFTAAELTDYGKGYRLGYGFGVQQQGGLDGTVTPVQQYRAA